MHLLFLISIQTTQKVTFKISFFNLKAEVEKYSLQLSFFYPLSNELIMCAYKEGVKRSTELREERFF